MLAEPLRRDHLVQVYLDERALLDAVVLFATVGLGKAEAVVLVATAPHVEAIRQRLHCQGVEVEDVARWGQLVLLEAEALLARFMVDGMPAAERFEATIAEVIDGARGGGRYRKVRVFGEMVDILWKHNLPAARRLEELWNEAIRAHGISLFCAYSLAGDGDEERPFPADLRALHSHLIPIEASA